MYGKEITKNVAGESVLDIQINTVIIPIIRAEYWICFLKLPLLIAEYIKVIKNRNKAGKVTIVSVPQKPKLVSKNLI
jgi:hypothetical protein